MSSHDIFGTLVEQLITAVKSGDSGEIDRTRYAVLRQYRDDAGPPSGEYHGEVMSQEEIERFGESPF